MAKGRVTRRLLFLLVAVLYLLLVIFNVLPNPLPAALAWLTADRPLAEGVAWQDRLGSRPAYGVVVGDAVAVAAGSEARLYQRDDGDPIGEAELEDWAAEWVLGAGDGDPAVVLSRERGQDGYQVRDPATGRALRQDQHAVAVWGFTDGWLDLRCDGKRACQVRAYRPDRIEPLWRVDLPGERDGMLGADPPLATGRSVDSRRIETTAAGRQPMPTVLGFPVTRGRERSVVVVDTHTGQVRQEIPVTDNERVLVVGDRVVRSEMVNYQGVCVSTVTGHDAVTGEQVWGPEQFHLWTTDGYGCQQRTAPLAGGAALTALALDGRPLVIDAYDGRRLWAGEPGERVETLSSSVAVIRATDERDRYAVRLGGNGDRLWQRRAAGGAEFLLASCGLIVVDRDPDRVHVWDPVTGESRVSVSTSARVLACAEDGILIANGRYVGFARFDGVTEPADPPPAASRLNVHERRLRLLPTAAARRGHHRIPAGHGRGDRRGCRTGRAQLPDRRAVGTVHAHRGGDARHRTLPAAGPPSPASFHPG